MFCFFLFFFLKLDLHGWMQEGAPFLQVPRTQPFYSAVNILATFSTGGSSSLFEVPCGNDNSLGHWVT